MFGFLGTIPAVLVARKARRNREEENFITATCSAGSDLSCKIKMWNETFCRPRGILIPVDLPSEALADLAEMDISSSQAQPGLGNGTSSDNSPGTSMSVQSLFHRLRIRPAQSEREEASYRARIVIIPHSKQAIAEQY